MLRKQKMRMSLVHVRGALIMDLDCTSNAWTSMDPAKKTQLNQTRASPGKHATHANITFLKRAQLPTSHADARRYILCLEKLMASNVPFSDMKQDRYRPFSLMLISNVSMSMESSPWVQLHTCGDCA